MVSPTRRVRIAVATALAALTLGVSGRLSQIPVVGETFGDNNNSEDETSTSRDDTDDQNGGSGQNESSQPSGGDKTNRTTDGRTATNGSDDDGPGFDIPGALTGIGGIWYLLRQRSNEAESDR